MDVEENKWDFNSILYLIIFIVIILIPIWIWFIPITNWIRIPLSVISLILLIGTIMFSIGFRNYVTEYDCEDEYWYTGDDEK